MFEIFSRFFKWLVRQALTLLVILGVLVGWAWMQGELKRADELRSDRAGEVSKRDVLFKEVEALKRNAAERARKAEAFVRNLESMQDRARVARQKLWDDHFWARKNPLSDVSLGIQLLDLEIAGYEATVGQVTRVKESAGKELNALVMQKEREIERIDGRIARIEETLDTAFGIAARRRASPGAARRSGVFWSASC